MIRVVTDSTGYLPPEIVAQHQIRVVPLNVHFPDGQVFQEGINLTNDEFYDKLSRCAGLPTTSQPAPALFQQVFEELTENGDQVICTVISSKMSGTYQSAIEARRQLPNADIMVVDSLSVATGLGLLTITAAEMAADESHSLEQIATRLEQMKHEIDVIFVVDTLEYLQKGGRIGTAAALVGTLLKVKPVLIVRDGIVQPVDKVRSRRKALQRLVDEFANRAGAADRTPQIFLLHAQAADDMNEIADQLRNRLKCSRIMATEVGAIVGTHAGPGVVGGAICPGAVPVKMPELYSQELGVPLPA